MTILRPAPLRRSCFALAFLAAITTSGCAGATAMTSDERTTPSATTTPSASPSASAPVVDTIILEAGQLLLVSEGAEVTALPMTELEPTLTALTDLLGAPVSTPGSAAPEGESPLAATPYTHSWGGDDLTLYESVGFTVTEYGVDVRVASIMSAEGKTVALAGPGNVRVGDDITALIASTPTELQQRSAGPDSPLVILQEGWQDSPPTVNKDGVGAFTTTYIVDLLRVPVSVPALD